MSIPSPSAPATRGWRVLRPIRLSTFLLLVLVIALMVSLALQRERQLRDAIAVYRQPQTEAIFEAVARPMPLHYLDGARLDEVLKVWKRTTIGSPGLAPGIPIYVDPIGLQEAGQSLNSTLRRPPSADSLPLGEHLRRVLEPLGLGCTVQHGFLMITSKESVDEEPDPYLLFRDVLQ